VIEAIAEARGHGDISENAEYDAAKEQQAFLEKKIRELENKIANADVVDPSTMSTERVVFGLQVTVQDLDTDEEISYQIVGVDEADIAEQRISISSPVARALIGKTVGEVVQVQIPRGMRELEILDISNP
jgi:transcription elongation factor GreA